MATVSGTFTWALPEDIDTDFMYIYSSTVEEGTYTNLAQIAYEYGEITYEYDSLDDTTWYKIRFYNSVDAEFGPYSDPVYGGDFDNASPFLAVSTTTDGAHYATIQDVYDYANLTTTDVTSSKIGKALKRARAVVDLRTAELDLVRFDLWDTEIARKKYNATLRILREAEINIALGNLYRGMADDKIMEQVRDDEPGEAGVAIGNTSLSDTSSLQAAIIAPQLMEIADRYSGVGAAMLTTIQPRSLRLTYQDIARTVPYFKWPFNGWK